MKNGWETSTLGHVYDVRDGTHDSPKYHDSGYPLITSKNLKKEGLSFDNVKLINEKEFEQINGRSAVHRGDVLFAMIGTIGNPTLVDVEPNFAIKNVALFKIPNGQSGSFLKHYLDSEWVISKMNGEAKGTTQKFVGLGYLRKFPINLPSLAEQQRIVGILDEAFAGLATAKANAEKNLQNARALFESHLQSVFSQRGEGWLETTLDDVTDLITCGVAKRPEYVPDGIPFLSAKNVKSGEVIWSGHQYVSIESHLALTKHNKPKIGDILYTRVGSFGEAAIVERDVEFSIFVSLTLIKPKPIVLNSFLKHYLNSSAVKELATNSISGSGVGNLNVGTVRKFPIYLPSTEEQEVIVSQLDKLRKETQRLTAIYTRKLAALEELKKALLHQAFSGEL